MKKILWTGLGLLICGSLNTSCVTRGENFSSDYSWVKAKTTTKSEVVRMLGEPYAVGYSSGRPTWTYGFYKFRVFGPSQTKELKFYWKTDTVDSFSFNSSFKEDRTRALK